MRSRISSSIFLLIHSEPVGLGRSNTSARAMLGGWQTFAPREQIVTTTIMSPSNRALVLSSDEKSQIQALDREQPVLLMVPGVAEPRTHSFVRHGTTTLFAALDVASGSLSANTSERHRAVEFLKYLERINGRVPEGLDVHIVMDNYATQKAPKIKA